MKNIYLKSNSHMRFEKGVMSEKSPVQVRRDVYAIKDEKNPKIYHVSIKNPENEEYIMVPKAMKIVEDRMGMQITLEGIKENDPDNIWGYDFSDYGIRFRTGPSTILTRQPAMADLLYNNRNTLITYQ